MKYPSIAAILILTLPQVLDAQDAPTAVERLRGSYTAAVNRAIDPLKNTYRKELNKLLDQYTKSGKLDDALVVRAELASLDSDSSVAASNLTPSATTKAVKDDVEASQFHCRGFTGLRVIRKALTFAEALTYFESIGCRLPRIESLEDALNLGAAVKALKLSEWFVVDAQVVRGVIQRRDSTPITIPKGTSGISIMKQFVTPLDSDASTEFLVIDRRSQNMDIRFGNPKEKYAFWIVEFPRP